jgi:hypothetical protein
LVIAEVRDSERLRQFLELGHDRTYHFLINRLIDVKCLSIAGDIIAPTRPDLPRGINQLGNTCYLNSLLQVANGLSLPHRLTSYSFLLSTSIPSKSSGRLYCQCRNWI